MSSVVTMQVKWDRTGKYNMKSQDKWTAYKVCKFFNDISQQLEQSAIINCPQSTKKNRSV
jgi:hypothetical protein